MGRQPYNGDGALEARVAVLESVLDEREKALHLLERNIDARLHLLNELRGDVMTRGEFIKSHESISSHVDSVEKAMSTRIDSVEKAQARLIGAAITLSAIGGFIGWVIGHIK